VQKRLTKSTKIYLRDSGLLHFLAGLRQSRDLTRLSRFAPVFRLWGDVAIRNYLVNPAAQQIGEKWL
jgi:hypothetical protein